MRERYQTAGTVCFADTKPHYEILDGLRGVATLLVVIYHIFEGLAFAEASASPPKRTFLFLCMCMLALILVPNGYNLIVADENNYLYI